MLCSNCGKREVEVLIKQVTNQETSDLNLCRICAEEMGFQEPKEWLKEHGQEIMEKIGR